DLDLAQQAQPRRRLPPPDRALAPGGGGMTANAVAPVDTAAALGRTHRMRPLRDTGLISRRSLILTIRQPTWIVIGIMYPVIYLVLFGPLLDGAIKQAGAGVSAYNWFVPRLLIQVALFGTAF